MPQAGRTAPRSEPYLPGEEGIWLFILGDMIVFGLFFVVYIYYRAQAPDLFDASQARLDVRLGLINTLLLLTSSWLVVMAVQAVRASHFATARALLCCAWLCGAGFVAIKAIEYHAKLGEGLTVVTNDFFMYYFMYTGIHLVHVLFGLVLLAWLIARSRTATSADVPTYEIGASFWHMVDLLWIMLFPLLYLIR